MILAQKTALLTFNDNFYNWSANPKNQPFFAKNAFLDAESSQTTENYNMQFYNQAL